LTIEKQDRKARLCLAPLAGWIGAPSLTLRRRLVRFVAGSPLNDWRGNLIADNELNGRDGQI
jgi:hypothetical protein